MGWKRNLTKADLDTTADQVAGLRAELALARSALHGKTDDVHLEAGNIRGDLAKVLLRLERIEARLTPPAASPALEGDGTVVLKKAAVKDGTP